MTATKFERFEYKYWLSDAIARTLLRQTTQFLHKDVHADAKGRNTSLYLDSPERDFVDAHLAGAPDRIKLRVRAYGNPVRDPAFFEVKRKVKAVTFKHRSVVPLAWVPVLLGRGPLRMPPLRTAQEEVSLQDFLYHKEVHQAEPYLLVTCTREAFSGTDPLEEMRLTMDRDVCYQLAQGPSLQGDPQGWVPLCGQGGYQPDATTLMEVKFRGVAPLWFLELVQRLELMPSGFSKYVTAAVHQRLSADEASRLLTMVPRL